MTHRLFAAVLVLVLAASVGAAAQTNGASDFSDVPADHERRADIDYAAARGWLTADEEGTFRPGQTLAAGEALAVVRGAFPEGASRADLATYIRAGSGAVAAYTAVITPNAFPDVADSHPQLTDIDNAATRGWFQGYPDGTFRPDQPVTDAQTATVVGRVFPEGVTRADLAAFMRAGNQALLEAGRPPAQSDEPAYTRHFVQQALDRYEEEGRQAAFARYNSADSVEGSWYLFVIENDVIVVQPTRPELRGTRSSHLTDAYGRPFAQEIAQAGEEGRWVDYVFLDPASGQNRQKHSWVIERDGLIFGSGWYEDEVPPPPGKDDPPAYTQYFVQQAVDRFNRDGRDAVIDHYNSEDSIDGPWYIFIIEDGVTVSIATNPELVGTRTGPRTDIYGKNYGRELAAADEAGRWVDYVRRNPGTDQLEQKHSWVIERGGLIFGSGWYEEDPPSPPGKDDPPAYTQYFVQQAVDRYREEGRQAAFAHYNSAASVDGPWYVFIFEDDNIVVHPTQPDLIGTDITHQTDVYGKPSGQQLAAPGEGGRWVDYVFNNPATGENGQKHSWVVEQEGLIFGSGWYEDEAPPPPGKDDPPAYTQYFVQQAVDRFNRDGRDAVIDHYNSEDSIDGAWYIFIIEDGTTVSIATNPELVGTRTGPRTDVNGKNYGIELAAADERGAWVDYVRRNPGTDQLEQKHSWVIKRGGLIFGSGWYEPAS